MKTTTRLMWTCSLIISLFVESCQTHKLNVHWGPQSMMYLKGKYGKRFVLESDRVIMDQRLQSFNALLKDIQRLHRPRPPVKSERVYIHSL